LQHALAVAAWHTFFNVSIFEEHRVNGGPQVLSGT
jgi:hypothetical protein